jgi:hypothetical protein
MDIQNSKERGLVARGDKDSLRSLFHLFVGKPDSTQKVLPRAVHVTPATLTDLNDRISEKLKTHHIEGMVASVVLIFEDRTTIEFGGWAEFAAFRWTTPKITKELRLRWHFLLAVQGYELPQQHALTVKLCSDAKPIELLQAMLSKHPAEDDGTHVNFAPTVVRVDFISHSIGQELISVVEQWNEGLPRPEARTGFFVDIDKHKEKIASLIDYSTPVLFAFASIGVLRKIYPTSDFGMPLTVGVGVGLMHWLICSLIAIYLSDKVSSLLAKSTYQAIDKYGMYSMFRMTNGDENRRQKIAAANKKQIRKFFISTLFSLLMNVSAGILVAIYWPTGT